MEYICCENCILTTAFYRMHLAWILHSNCRLFWNTFAMKTAFRPQPFMEYIWPQYFIPTTPFYGIHLAQILHSNRSILWNTFFCKLHSNLNLLWYTFPCICLKFCIPFRAFYGIYFLALAWKLHSNHSILIEYISYQIAFQPQPFMEYSSLHWPENCMPTTGLYGLHVLAWELYSSHNLL